MNILEQNYNTNRPYYHGCLQGINKQFSNYNFFFIATDPLYALSYSKEKDCSGFSHFYEIHLKRRLNIINLKSKTDINYMKDACIKSKKFGYLQVLSALQTRDWSAIFGNDKERDCFLSLINSTYDGFFNYEYDKVTTDYSKISRYDLNYEPSIGIMNIDSLNIYEIDPFSLDRVKEREIKDANQLKRDIYLCMKSNDKNIAKTKSYIEDRMQGAEVSYYLTMTKAKANDMIQYVNDNFTIIEDEFYYSDNLIKEALDNNGITSTYYHGVNIKLW
jgi:hypothetical protein